MCFNITTEAKQLRQDETMKELTEFKVDDRAVRISCFTENLPKGHVSKVLKDCLCTDINGVHRDFWPPFWELVPEDIKPKWTIYNNTLPWSDLSDKQKGKLLLAKLNDIALCVVVKSLSGDENFINNIEIIDNRGECVYRAQPKPVKPEPTMAELFVSDWHGTDVHLVKDFSEHMIAKGWVKK
jgi:hypothetical protein